MSETQQTTRIVNPTYKRLADHIANSAGPYAGLVDIAAEIDTLTAERDEARAKLEIYSGNAADHEVRIDALKAEVERLRPINGIYQAFLAFAANPTDDAAVEFTENAVRIAEEFATREAAKGQA